jgi:TolA-binding protein
MDADQDRRRGSEPPPATGPPRQPPSPEAVDTPTEVLPVAVEPQWRPEPPAGPPRWPPAVALLNLTGLALGYAHLARWVRFALYLAATVALVAVGFATDAAERPWQWRGLLLAWPVWMAFDGWWLAGRNPAGGTAPRTRPTLVAAGAVLVVVAGYALYGVAGAGAFDAGVRAQAAGDCRTAVARYDRVTGPFELTLSQDVRAAAVRRAECESFLGAVAAQDAGRFGDAVDRYLEFIGAYPGSTLRSVAADRLRDSHLANARALRDAREYGRAVAAYREVLTGHPGTEAAAQARPELAETYLAEAAGHRASLDPAGGTGSTAPLRLAVDNYLLVQQDLADTPAAQRVPQALTETFAQATAPLAAGNPCAALPALDYFVGLPPATGLVDPAHGHRATAQWECGVASYGRGAYVEAIGHFEALTVGYPRHALAPAARSALIAALVADSGPESVPRLPPPLGGDSPGANRVTIYNSSPVEVEVLIAGPTAHRFVLPACADCLAEYPSGDAACADLDGRPSRTLRLRPGSYHLASRDGGGVGRFGLSTMEVHAGYWHTTCRYRTAP